MEKKENREVILSLNHIDITFGKGRKLFKAVSDVSFDIYKGETVSLVGESGSGKTTIGRAVVRINPLSAGYIKFKDDIINGKLPPEEFEAYKAKIDEKIKAVNEEYEPKIAADPNNKELIKEKNNQIKLLEETLSCAKGKIPYQKRREYIRKIQMVFQDPTASLNERTTIDYIVSEGLNAFHLYKDERERVEKVEKIIQDVGLLPEHLTRYPHEFSGGQRQRIGLARSIVMEPEFIVADEPISALDVSIRAQVLNLLKKFQNERGLTYLFIAHDLSIVRFISDRIVVIHLGKIVEIAETEELFNYPLHPYTKSLMSAIPIPDPILEKSKTLITYDAKDHKYGPEENPQLVDIGHGHFVYGNEAEIANYKKIREGK
ncbi:MAG: ATP-binding cassette domain-containing protein [Erysipelotrichaceae bacterium]|jgi:oligopeptide transport system ATP-binding protein|nr:ATP-binding cassette domain-containing protein [Erysipelotrichaceae bacterium]